MARKKTPTKPLTKKFSPRVTRSAKKRKKPQQDPPPSGQQQQEKVPPKLLTQSPPQKNNKDEGEETPIRTSPRKRAAARTASEKLTPKKTKKEESAATPKAKTGKSPKKLAVARTASEKSTPKKIKKEESAATTPTTSTGKSPTSPITKTGKSPRKPRTKKAKVTKNATPVNPITPESKTKSISPPASSKKSISPPASSKKIISPPASSKKTIPLPPPPSSTEPPKIPPLSPPPSQIAVNVHRFRDANYIPRGILKLCATPLPATALSTSQTNLGPSVVAPYLAVSREGGSVELVSVDEKWKCVSIVEGMKKRNVDSMAWICGNNTPPADENGDSTMMITDEDEQNHQSNSDRSNSHYFSKHYQDFEEIQSNRRLFGSSRDGTIFEIDFQSKKHIGVIGSGGGAVFCLSSLPPTRHNYGCSSLQLLAAGCEDGSVRIFKAVDKKLRKSDIAPSLELISTLPSVGCAITSIAWLPPPNTTYVGGGGGGLEGSVLYAGVADGTIRKFTVTSTIQNARATGSVPHAMSTGMVLAASDENSTRSSITDQSSLSGLQWKATIRLTVENRGRRVTTKIWSLKALDDGTLISGDSMGNIQFWDGNAGTLLQTFEHNPNNADVLDVAVGLNQDKVFASGIDSKVVCFELNKTSTTSNRWILSNQQRCHSHDVNSLAMVYMTDPDGCAGGNALKKMNYRELLCSGGIDTKVSSYLVQNMRGHRPKVAYKYPSNAPIALSRGPRIMSIMRADRIDFYQLGDKRPVPEKKGPGIALDEQKAHLGSVSISTDYNLTSFDMNDDGTFLAVSHAGGLHLFSLEFVDSYEEDDEISRKIVKPTKIDVPLTINASCSSLKFSRSDPNLLICANCSGTINVVKINKIDDRNYNISLEHTFNKHVTTSIVSNNYPISHLEISPDGRWLAAAKNTVGKGCLLIFALSPIFNHWWTVPCTEAPLSCIQWLGDGGSYQPALAVGLNNGVFYLFDVEQRCLSEWSQDLGFPAGPNLPRELSQCGDCPDRIAFNPATPSKFLMGGQTWFCSVDLDAPVPQNSKPYPSDHFKAKIWGKNALKERSRSNSFVDDSPSPAKRRRSLSGEKNLAIHNNNFTICLRYLGMIFLDFLGENEMVVVEQPWREIVKTLPDALERQRYGS